MSLPKDSHMLAVGIEDLPYRYITVNGVYKSLAELTPDECFTLVESIVGTKQAQALQDEIGVWDKYGKFYVFNEVNIFVPPPQARDEILLKDVIKLLRMSRETFYTQYLPNVPNRKVGRMRYFRKEDILRLQKEVERKRAS